MQIELTQKNAPIYEALLQYKEARIVPFDVPGHKHGKGNPALTDFLGEKCMSVDVNSMKALDNLCHPVSVIKDAENLAAKAFKAHTCFFTVGGTTAAVQSMIMSVCKTGDKIIMPRNVHRSAINALVISGAIPVYVNPGIHEKLGIPGGTAVKDIEKAIKANPEAKAVFVNNPTYYGICSDIKKIAQLAHENNMVCIADEAHGTNLYFADKSEDMPPSAMAAGADLSAVSIHKSGGSLTQSSIMLISENAVSSGLISPSYVRAVINLTQTTSASYLLLSSLDIARRTLALDGLDIVSKIIENAEYARAEIAKIGGYYAFGQEIINNNDIYSFDKTKLSVHTRDIGLAGIEVYDLLRDRFDIQIEFGDIGNILAYISQGDKWKDIERLVSALSEIKRRFSKDKAGLLHYEYITPQIILSPQEAFYGQRQEVGISDSVGRISGEFVMCYPPGIPILAPGELITAPILEYIAYSKEKGCSLTGTEDMGLERIKVII